MGLLKEISPLRFGFGGGSISGEGGGYGFGPISESESIQLLREAYELGVRIFDTAPIYGFGLSEERMGKALGPIRDQVFLISKSGVDWGPDKRVNMTNDPRVAERMLGETLRRLNTDYIDLYLVHWPDSQFDIRQTLEPLVRAQAEGKIRHLGLCNTTMDDLNKAQELAKIRVVQSEFNLFRQEASLMFPYLHQQDISFMAWGPFDKGILSGRVTKDRKFDAIDARSWAPWWKAGKPEEKLLKAAELEKIAKSQGLQLKEFAVRELLKFSEVECVLIGARSSAQLREAIEIVKKFS